MLNWLSRTFFNFLYKVRPPKMVQYWKRGEGVLARIKNNPKGHYEMQVQGETESMPGFPRGPVLFSSLGKLKHEVKTRVFNAVAGDLKKLALELKIDMIEPDKMIPAVKHIWDTFEKLENCEVTEDMKDKIKLMKECICFFLDDDAYRYRTQLFLSMLDQKKVGLSKQDKYYFRAKYFRVDRYKKILGRWYDGYEY